MRKAIFVGFGFLLAAAIVVAQGHDNSAEKTARATIMLGSDVKFGDQVVKAGEYRVTCNRETIVFSESTNRDRASRTFRFPCKGQELPEPSQQTDLSSTVDASGQRIAQRLLLKGSNVEHVFE